MERLTYEIMDGGMVTDKENVKEFEIEDWVTVYAGNAVFRLAEYEDTGLTPAEIMELNESVQRLDKIFGDEITVDQVIDFFVDFYIAQCDDERVEAAELLTNEEVERYKQLKERDTAKAPEVFDGHWYKCPKCGIYAGGLKGNFCHRCGQRLK